MTANWPIPYANVGSRRTAACVTLGAISLRSSNHFPHKLYSNIIKPVALAPGCDKLSTRPDPTGSTTMTNTIGMVWVAFTMISVAAPPPTTSTSGASAISSAACFRAAEDRKQEPRDALVPRQLAPAHCPGTSRCLRQRFAAWPGRTSFDAPTQAPFRRVQRRSPPTARHLFGGLLASCEARATSSSRPTEEERPRRAEARVLAAIALQQWRL